MKEKLTVLGTIKEGALMGVKNAASVLGAVVLWLVTIWIPYINVGTTIAICSLPLELSKGNVLNPLSIFDAKYRKFMGEFFSLIGLMLIALIPAYLFLIVPGIIIMIGWSLSILLLLDKGMSPSDAMAESTKLTYGYKWRIFLIGLIVGVAASVLVGIFTAIFGADSVVNSILALIVYIIEMAVGLCCDAVIYRNLTAAEPVEVETAETLDEK